MKRKILGSLTVLACVLAIGYTALWNSTRNLNDFRDDFLNAVYAGDVTKVESMLKAGENPNKRDSSGNNPMTLAAFAGHADVLTLLLAHGAEIRNRDNMGMTPLHCSAYYNRVKVGKILLKNGADINATNIYGYTPLSEAVIKGFPDMLELLLEAGVTVTNRDKRGWQPIHQVLRSNRISNEARIRIVSMLIDHGADPNAENPGGWQEDSKYDSAVHPFAYPRMNPNKGNTPLQIAKSNGFQEIVNLLLKHGAKE